ncbi:MAG: glycosyltransferase [Cytophagales bacterium]|nr:glycosyltransferase [Cytophagales bacterium]
MTVVFVVILSFYCGLLVVALTGWDRVRKRPNLPGGTVSGISIIVPFRNEEENLANLISSLLALDYPTGLWEVLLINDHSEDHSLELALSLTQGQSHMHVWSLPDGAEGKKLSLKAGIGRARFPIVATTDADCRVPVRWLMEIHGCFHDRASLLIGLIKFRYTHSFFGKLQMIELAGLMGSTAAAVGWNHPILSTGANLAFRKEHFLAVGGYDDNLHIASGDDEFLMRKMARQFPDGLVFMNAPDAVVETVTQHDLFAFFRQRIRWAGKWRFNSDATTKGVAIVVAAAQFCFLLIALSRPDWGHLFVVAKILLEGALIYRASTFLRERPDWIGFIALQILYPVYIVITGVSSFFAVPSWKGRKL